MSLIEWSAFVLGTVGTIIWATNWRGGNWASVLWLISAILWTIFAYLNGHKGLIGRDLIGIGLYAYATYQWKSGGAGGKRRRGP